jgi:hypothetical protein
MIEFLLDQRLLAVLAVIFSGIGTYFLSHFLSKRRQHGKNITIRTGDIRIATERLLNTTTKGKREKRPREIKITLPDDMPFIEIELRIRSSNSASSP